MTLELESDLPAVGEEVWVDGVLMGKVVRVEGSRVVVGFSKKHAGRK